VTVAPIRRIAATTSSSSYCLWLAVHFALYLSVMVTDSSVSSLLTFSSGTPETGGAFYVSNSGLKSLCRADIVLSCFSMEMDRISATKETKATKGN
jgi:hypothetical protein